MIKIILKVKKNYQNKIFWNNKNEFQSIPINFWKIIKVVKMSLFYQKMMKQKINLY